MAQTAECNLCVVSNPVNTFWGVGDLVTHTWSEAAEGSSSPVQVERTEKKKKIEIPLCFFMN